jgi:hypothetical protein
MWLIDVSPGCFGVLRLIIAAWFFWMKQEPVPKWRVAAAARIEGIGCVAKFRMVIGRRRRLSRPCGIMA